MNESNNERPSERQPQGQQRNRPQAARMPSDPTKRMSNHGNAPVRRTPPRKRRKKYDIRIILLSALLVVALVVILILCLKSCNGNTPDTPSDSTPTVIGGGDPIPEEQSKEKDTGNIHLPAYGSLTFKAGTKEQTVVLQNPGENSCLIRISLILENGTTIYTSELVKPGYYTKPITLVAPMERGIYRNVTLKYECFTDDEAHKPLNGATSKLDITVQ